MLSRLSELRNKHFECFTVCSQGVFSRGKEHRVARDVPFCSARPHTREEQTGTVQFYMHTKLLLLVICVRMYVCIYIHACIGHGRAEPYAALYV